MIQCDSCKREITTGGAKGKPKETDLGMFFNPPQGVGVPGSHFCMKCTGMYFLVVADLIPARRDELEESVPGSA